MKQRDDSVRFVRTFRSTLKVYAELRAPNYPGSTYTLTYDPKGDLLKGIYIQAVMQQRFDVVFVRMK